MSISTTSRASSSRRCATTRTSRFSREIATIVRDLDFELRPGRAGVSQLRAGQGHRGLWGTALQPSSQERPRPARRRGEGRRRRRRAAGQAELPRLERRGAVRERRHQRRALGGGRHRRADEAVAVRQHVQPRVLGRRGARPGGARRPPRSCPSSSIPASSPRQSSTCCARCSPSACSTATASTTSTARGCSTAGSLPTCLSRAGATPATVLLDAYLRRRAARRRRARGAWASSCAPPRARQLVERARRRRLESGRAATRAFSDIELPLVAVLTQHGAHVGRAHRHATALEPIWAPASEGAAGPGCASSIFDVAGEDVQPRLAQAARRTSCSRCMGLDSPQVQEEPAGGWPTDAASARGAVEDRRHAGAAKVMRVPRAGRSSSRPTSTRLPQLMRRHRRAAMHTCFNETVTTTGRLSALEPEPAEHSRAHRVRPPDPQLLRAAAGGRSCSCRRTTRRSSCACSRTCPATSTWWRRSTPGRISTPPRPLASSVCRWRR